MHSGVQYIKLLVRKVATIYHALDAAVEGQFRAAGRGGMGVLDPIPSLATGTISGAGVHTGGKAQGAGRDGGCKAPPSPFAGLGQDGVLIWADADVAFVRPPDARLLDFAKRYDLTYVPFQAPEHTKRFNPSFNFSGGLLNDLWVVESGVMTFRTTERSRALAAAAVEMYEGGSLRLAQRCSAARGLRHLDERQRRCPSWMGPWLYPNDIYVWAVLLRIAYAGLDVSGEVCCMDHSLTNGLTQGWLPWHTSKQLLPSHTIFTAPFSLDEFAVHQMAGPVSRVTHLGTNATRPRDPSLYIKAINVTAYHSPNDRRQPGHWPTMVVRCGCAR